MGFKTIQVCEKSQWEFPDFTLIFRLQSQPQEAEKNKIFQWGKQQKKKSFCFFFQFNLLIQLIHFYFILQITRIVSLRDLATQRLNNRAVRD